MKYLKFNFKDIEHGKDFRFGYRKTSRESGLIVRVKKEARRPIKVSLAHFSRY
ncbi:unnamed protein product [marine sediment metagenome]|uniref:Uncharacterized protein n=1 Tax=marine sediment metagenome TaxID=412755 RepID=X0XYV0_9ZZZZ